MKIVDVYLGEQKVSDIIKESLGLEANYIQHLLESDDWSMMILSWALLEASLNYAIRMKLANESLANFVEQLSVSGRTSKTSLAASLDLIGKSEVKFINTYSTVRNRFAHGIKRFRTTFDEYFADIKDTAEYENALLTKEVISQDGDPINFANNKRNIIFMNVIAICTGLARTK